MTDPLQEQLSACLDGTLSAAELDLLIKRVERDTALGATLGRYALIGEALKAERPVAASSKSRARFLHSAAAQAKDLSSGRPSVRCQDMSPAQPPASRAVQSAAILIDFMTLPEFRRGKPIDHRRRTGHDR